MSMILHAKNGTVELNETTIKALRKAWVTKDVDTELARMHLWLLAHEKKRPAYFWVFVKNWMKRAPDLYAPTPGVSKWWQSDAGTDQMAIALGMSARPGEDMAAFRNRINVQLEARKALAPVTNIREGRK